MTELSAVDSGLNVKSQTWGGGPEEHFQAPSMRWASSPPESGLSASGARLTLLNVFTLSKDGGEVVLSRPAQRLLAFLALQDHPLMRDYVAEALWLDSTQEHAAGSLRSALFLLRRVRGELVEAHGGRLRLAPSMMVDVFEGVGWARRVLDPATDIADLDGGASTFSGDILPDWYDDWVLLERERFRALRVHALEALSARLTAAGRFGEAMDAALAAIHGEPLRESAHRAVIGVHLAEGNHAEALAEYRRFRDRLREQLGLAPSRHMHELLCRIEGR